jgi:hypothetical protein
MVKSGLASGRVSIQVAAIETRSLPSSLAAARRGFTFYLADPSARLTSIAKAVRVNRPYLFVVTSYTPALPAAPAGGGLLLPRSTAHPRA